MLLLVVQKFLKLLLAEHVFTSAHFAWPVYMLRTGQLQSGCYGISCIAWSCPTIPQSASSCRWPAHPSPTPFFFDASAARSPFRLSTVGRRSFPVAAAILWNTLPVDVQSSPSLPVFRQRLKTFLFHRSFPDVAWQADYAFVDFVMAYCYFSHVKNFLIDLLIVCSQGSQRLLQTMNDLLVSPHFAPVVHFVVGREGSKLLNTAAPTIFSLPLWHSFFES